MSDYEVVIGLEVHVQLKTESKLFCSCYNLVDKDEPNTHVCPVCMGFVGALPTLNKLAVEHTVKTGLALSGDIAKHSKWDRKSYFYPDLPKAYQISQFDVPLVSNGHLDIVMDDGSAKRIRMNRIHLEEDAAKSTHEGNVSLIDFNRSSIPLMEIVTEPDLRSPEEAELALRELRRIVRYVGVSYADLEKGHLRCDASISLRPRGEDKLYARTEIKNLNSFKMVAKALNFEINRQKMLWDEGNPDQHATTALWDDDKGRTLVMRGKEDAADYRYFPEPDVPEVDIEDEFIEELQKTIPVLPSERLKRYADAGIEVGMSRSLVEDMEVSDFLNKILDECSNDVDSRDQAVKVFLGEISPRLADGIPTDFDFETFVTMIKHMNDGKVSKIKVKEIVIEYMEKKGNLSKLLDAALNASSDIDLDGIVAEVLKNSPKVIEEYKSGKEKAINVLIGQIIGKTGGSVPAGMVVKALKDAVEKM